MGTDSTDKNVYLLGAGFSKELGLPLQDDFLMISKEVYFKDTQKYEHFKWVFEYQDKLSKMRKFLNYPLLNLEHLFNLIEMDIFYSKNPDVQKIKDYFKRMICDVLIDRTPHPFRYDKDDHLFTNGKYNNYLRFLNLFIKNDQKHVLTHNDTIISFNYDLILDGAATIYNWNRRQNQSHMRRGDEHYLHFNVIFDKENIQVNNINNYFLNLDNVYFPDSLSYKNENSAIKYLKLHGSINWIDNNSKETFIVPPTWNKSDERVRRLWEIAYEEISKAKRIIILGYSFPETDIYVKSLLALALNENRILQNIYFINPDKEVAKQNCLSMLDSHFEKYCNYLEWTFSHFISSDSGKYFIKHNLNRDVSDKTIMPSVI